ncbi:MAG: DoxX family membrane protein [Patescibacteria group bacterium]
MEYLFVLGRILLGGYFIMSGANHFKHLANFTHYAKSKGVPMPREAVMLSGLMLILGGLGILLGVYVEFAVLLLSVFLVVTTMQMHQFWKIEDQMTRMGEEINFKKNLALLGGVLMILAIPLPWAVSLML